MATTITLYGISSCDQVKKARAWLASHGIDHVFHDFKKSGLERPHLEKWLSHTGWEALLNRKGTTWRSLSDDRKAAVLDAETAIRLMIESPSVVKRPVLAANGGVHVGFSDDLYQRLFKK